MITHLFAGYSDMAHQQVKIHRLLLPFLFACFIGWNSISSAQSTTDHPVPTLSILITPDLLFGPSVSSEPRRDRDVVGPRIVSTQAMSETQTTIGAFPSTNSLGVRINVTGTTVSQASTRIRNREVLSNDLTQFSVEQKIQLTPFELNSERPTVKTKTVRLPASISSQRLVGSCLEEELVRTAFSLFRENINHEAAEFAKQKLVDEFDARVEDARFNFNNLVSRFETGDFAPRRSFFPEWEKYRFSSTDRVWQIRSDFRMFAQRPPPLFVAPVSMRIFQGPINRQLERQFAGLTLSSDEGELTGIRGALFRRPRNSGKSHSWTIQFADKSPVRVNFDANKILLAIKTDQLSIDQRDIPSATLIVNYWLEYSGGWQLVRDEDLSVDLRSGDSTLGARQQIIQTILKKRIPEILAKTIKLPTIHRRFGKGPKARLVDLEFKTITTRNGWIAFSLGHPHSSPISSVNSNPLFQDNCGCTH